MSYEHIPLLLGFWDIARVVATIMGIGGVIFFHELGHFMVARWNGVRTEAFSLGFPPNGLRIRRREDGLHFFIIGREAPLFTLPWLGSTTDVTEYRIGLLPIGGYVKMAGEGIGEGTGAQDELRSKSVAARGAIFSAGVVMNVIFAVIAFTIAFQVGVKLIAPVAGDIVPGSAAAKAGIRPGDRFVAIDGQPITSFGEIQAAIAFADGVNGMTVELERDGQPLVLEQVIPAYSKAVGRQQLGVTKAGSNLLVAVDEPALGAGVKAGDRVVEINGTAVRYQHELLNVFSKLARVQTNNYHFVLERTEGGATTRIDANFTLDQVRKNGWAIGADVPGGWLVPPLAADSALRAHGLEPGDLVVEIGEEELRNFTLNPKLADESGNPKPWSAWLEEYDGGTADLVVYRGAGRLELDCPLTPADWTGLAINWQLRMFPRRDRPAAHAGVQAGDDLISVGGKPATRFSEVVSLINEHPGKPVELRLRNAAGEERTVSMTTWLAAPRSFGLTSYEFEQVLVQAGPFKALSMGWDASLNFGKQVLQTISGIARRKVSAEKNLGGPLTIVTTTHNVTKLGFGMTIYFLAILSVNLAILNVLPIPVLDGGHLFFLGVEAVRRRPVSDNIQIAAQYVGLLLLLALMVYVTINDIGRF